MVHNNIVSSRDQKWSVIKVDILLKFTKIKYFKGKFSYQKAKVVFNSLIEGAGGKFINSYYNKL